MLTKVRRKIPIVWHARAIALLTAGMGVVNVLSGALPALKERVALLRQILPLSIRYDSRLAAVLAGFALFVLATSLWRRKRVAWWVTLAVLVTSVIIHLTKGLDWEEATLSAGLICYLLTQRRHFTARSDTPTMLHGMRVFAGALFFTLTYGVIGFWLLDRHFKVDFGLHAAIEQTIDMFLYFSDPGLQPVTRFGAWFGNSIYAVGAATTGYALLSLLRPVLWHGTASVEERRRARTIVERYGRSSVARFTLFDDKSYWFSPDGSVIAYRVCGRTAVAMGDPIGPMEDAPAAIRGFRQWCEERDWLPCFFQTLPDYLGHYQDAGFGSLCIGHEAIVDMETFTLSGGQNKSLRGHVTRLQKAGFTTELCLPHHSAELIEELEEVSNEWLINCKGGEKRFSLGWFDEDYLQDGPVLLLRTPTGKVCAFANIIPEYNISESTIDLMRYTQDSQNGSMDTLFVALFQWAKAQGYKTFNLGLSPLAGVGEKSGDRPIERAVYFLYEHINHFYNFKGLFQYKKKFHPNWSPRYLVYPGPTALPRAAMAVIQANNPTPLWKFLR
jgi:phosphatidylglycerol lysyltransferase